MGVGGKGRELYGTGKADKIRLSQALKSLVVGGWWWW